MGWVGVSKISMKPCKLQGRTAGSQGALDKSRLCQKCQEGAEGKKMPVGKKCPLKTIALVVDEKEKAIKSSQGRAQSWWRPSQAWEARVECWWHGILAWKWMKIQQQRTSTNEDRTTKWTKSQKPPRRFSQAKHHCWEFWTFDF